MTTMFYPFGKPVLPREPAKGDHPRCFVLGAYPSALHARWTSPDGKTTIGAIPIDNEPEPFWEGLDTGERIDAWKASVDFKEEHGNVTSPGTNGSSGRGLTQQYLEPLGLHREDCWITDCLDTYFMSVDGEKALTAKFPGSWRLESHPSERQIIDRAIQDHISRLRTELREASPEFVITLGEAANQVFGITVGAEAPPKLIRTDYGVSRTVTHHGNEFAWVPLCHPGLIAKNTAWAAAHESWVSERQAVSRATTDGGTGLS